MQVGRKRTVFSYVPYWSGNREQNPQDQIVLDLLPITRLERLAQENWTTASILAWIEKKLPHHWNNPDYGALFPDLPEQLLKGFRQFVEHVTAVHHAVLEDEKGKLQEVTDPATLFLWCVGEIYDHLELFAEGPPRFNSPEEAAKAGLIAEIQHVLAQTAILTGDDLKNFLSRCVGSSTASITHPSASSAGADTQSTVPGEDEPTT